MSAPAITSTPDTVERFAQRFRGLDRAYGTFIPAKAKKRGSLKLEGKFDTPRKPVTSRHYEDHLQGLTCLGIIPVTDEGTCWFGAIDIDLEKYPGIDFAKLEARCDALGLPLIPCESKSGGCHLYFFASEPISAQLVIKKLKTWAEVLGYPKAEIFPKQSALTSKKDVGNWINLPYFGETRPALRDGEPMTLEKFLDQADAAATTEAELRELMVTLPKPSAMRGVPDQVCQGERNPTLWRAGCSLRGKGLEYEAILAELTELNQRCDPPLSESEVDDIAQRAAKYEAGQPLPDAEGVVEELNKRHALVLVGDKSAILQEGGDAGGRPEVRLLSLGAFKEWHRPHRVSLGNRTVSRAEFWLNDPHRRQYEGLVFAPGGTVEHHYNLWRGLAIEPNPEGDCSLFLEHLRDNVCRGREDLYLYLVGWLAQLIRQPATKLGTSIVLRGAQGVGKTIVGKTMGVILGDHYALVSDPRYITGRFNAHLTSTLLLHADEGFWAGDRAAEGKLKDLITGDYQWIEFKGKEAIRVRNYVRLLVTGNADWIVPAGLEERRFAVLDVGEGRKQNHAYFGAIEDQLQAGGYGALLHHLQTFDLTQVNLRRIPETGALFEQKLASLSPEEGWLLDILTNGKLPGDTKGEGRAPTPLLYDHYVRQTQRVGVRRRGLETQLGRFLWKHFPKLKKCEGSYSDPATAETRRCYVYEFPKLKECRAAFATATRHPGDWDGPIDWARGDLI